MPTLFEYGEGILRTHVTWEDLKENCLEVFGEDAVFGPNKAVTSIGDNRGFLSKMCLIEPDWKLDSPKKFVVKVCTQIARIEVMKKLMENSDPKDSAPNEQMQETISAGVRMIHNVEVDSYELLKKYNIQGVPTPKIYKGVKFSEDVAHKGYIIMEYVGNILNFNIYDNIAVEDAKEGLKAIAAMQAASLDFSDEEKAALPLAIYKMLNSQIFEPNAVKAAFVTLKEVAGCDMGTKLDKLEEVIFDILDLEAFEVGNELGIPSVFVHGDLWSTNLLWSKMNEENLKLSAIIDFQTAHFGCPATDILRFMGANLSGKDRHENWEKLVDYFYEELLKAIGSTPAPYSLEQLKENIRRLYPLAGALLVPMMGPIFQIIQRNPDEEQRMKAIEPMLDKMEFLIDDMLFFHERNVGLKTAPKKE